MTGRELCILRNEFGFRMADIANLFGVVPSTVSRWERSEIVTCDPRSKQILMLLCSQSQETRKEKGMVIMKEMQLNGDLAGLKALLSLQ